MSLFGKNCGRGLSVRTTTTIIAPPRADEIKVTVHPSCPNKGGAYVAPGQGPLFTEHLDAARAHTCFNVCCEACKL